MTTEPTLPNEPSDSAAAAPVESPSTVSRLKATKETWTERAVETRERLEASRNRSETIDTVFSAVERDSDTGGGVLAAALGFRVFIFIVPYVFVVVSGLGFIDDTQDDSTSDLAHKYGIGGLTATAVKSMDNASFFERISALVVGTFALFLAAKACVKVLRIVHALIWGVRLPKLVSPSRAAGLFILIVTVALLFAAIVGAARSATGPIIGLIATILYMLVPTFLWLYISWVLPHPPCSWTVMIPGAIFFGVGVEALHIVTVYWIAHLVSSKSETYGAIGTALALLFWAYLLGRLMTTAAVLNVVRYRKHHPGAVDA